MIGNISFIILILVTSLGLNGQTINSEDSKVTFSVSNMAFNTVKGTFNGMEGEIYFSPNDLLASKFEVCIDASSINTGNQKRDKHLKNEDFFEVEKYPNICFKSTEVEKTTSGNKTKGILTMHGVSKKVEIPFTFKNNQFIGNFEVNRKDYKIGEGTGSFMVGKEIEIQIVCFVNQIN